MSPTGGVVRQCKHCSNQSIQVGVFLPEVSFIWLRDFSHVSVKLEIQRLLPHQTL